MVGEVRGELAYTPLEETWQKKKPLDEDLRRVFAILSD
jgi:6-phosphofructokinase 1